jgi:hypothetical protein
MQFPAYCVLLFAHTTSPLFSTETTHAIVKRHYMYGRVSPIGLAAEENAIVALNRILRRRTKEAFTSDGTIDEQFIHDLDTYTDTKGMWNLTEMEKQSVTNIRSSVALSLLKNAVLNPYKDPLLSTEDTNIEYKENDEEDVVLHGTLCPGVPFEQNEKVLEIHKWLTKDRKPQRKLSDLRSYILMK